LLSIIAAVTVPMMSTLVRHLQWGLFTAPAPNLESISPAARYGPLESAAVSGTDTAPATLEQPPVPVAAALAPRSVVIPWRLVIASGWIVATIILTARLLVTFLLGMRLLRGAEPLHRTDIQQAAHSAKAKLAVDRPVRILCAARVRTVLIWCWSKQPVLLIPRAAAQGGEKVDWTSVLCHELAHYKRRDHIAGLLAELAVCVLPWNSLLWLAKSRLVRLSEQACDDWVLASGQQVEDYAESLLNLLPQRQMAFAPAVVSSKKGLAGRIRRILRHRCTDPRTGALWALAVTIIATFLAITAAFAQTRPAKESDSPLIKCSGKVIDQYGQPLAGAKVTAYKIVSDGIAGNIQLTEIGRLVTESGGEFAFETERKPERPTVVFGAVVVAKKQGLAVGWANWPLSDDTRVTIELGNAAKLAGVVVDKDAIPVTGAQVQAALFKKGTPTQEQTEWLPGIAPLQCLSVRTDNKGCFEFDNIPSGVSADLLLTAPGLATMYTRKPENIRSGYEGAAFKAGKTDIKIIMPPEARIEGKIVERETDIRVPHVPLAVVPHFTPTFFERFLCVSKEDGSFSIGGLQSGEYLLRTEPVQGEAPRMNVTVESGQTTSDVIFELPPGAAFVLAGTGAVHAATTIAKSNQIGPRITFASEIHDFGQVPAGSRHTCRFKFKNTGDAVLRVKQIRPSCSCTAAKLAKKEYAPGEGGTITITHSASRRPVKVSKRTSVYTNDAARPRTALTIKADVVLIVDHKPEKLELSLKAENAGCPQIALASTDGQPFSVKGVTSPRNCISVDFDSSVQAAKFVLQPKVELDKLKSNEHGYLRIQVSHPKCDTVQIPYHVRPRFSVLPRSIMLRGADPNRPTKRKLKIVNNYGEDFEIESVSCRNGTIEVVNEEKTDHHVNLELEITPAPIADKTFCTDVLYISIKDGEQLRVDVRLFYPRGKKALRPRKDAEAPTARTS
jgi:beta-lactamase regulating signal transducer with metallopeptidase domain